MKKIKELTSLYEISRAMHTLDLHQILKLILEGVTKSLSFDRARLYLVDEESNQLKCKLAVGVEHKQIKNIALPLDKKSSIVARSFLEQQPYIIKNAQEDSRVNPDLKELFNLKSFVAVPIIGREKVWGVITADNLYSNRKITTEKVQTLFTFTTQAGVAIENAYMYEKLKKFTQDLEEKVKITTEDLKKTEDQLFHSGRLAVLGQLAAGIAHELRNPLTSIKILANAIRKNPSSIDELLDDLHLIETEIHRMENIINQFLEFAKPSKLTITSVKIDQLLKDTLELVKYELEEYEIHLKTNLPPYIIQADKDQLKQAFLNLILNSVQAMPEGGILEISMEKEDRLLNIIIKDTGKGIPKKYLSQVFNPFFTTKKEGLGLGLSIVKRIVEKHGGSIFLHSQEKQETSVTVKIPIGD